MLKYTWMHLKQKSVSVLKKIQKLPKWVVVLVVAILLIVSVYLVLFLPENNVQFSYNNSNCTQQLTILPSYNKNTDNNSGFTIRNENIVKWGSLQILSLKTCFDVTKPPLPGNTRVSTSLMGGWFAKKTYLLTIPVLPTIQTAVLDQPIPIMKSLALKLDKADLVFSYQLVIGDKFASCPVKEAAIYCDITSLKLLQGNNYNIKINRLFKGQVLDTLVNKDIKTLNATNVVDASINAGQVVYDKPKSFTFDFDKSVTKGSVVINKVEGEKHTVIPSASVFDDKKVTLTVVNDLERNVAYEIIIDQIEAKDGSTLPGQYKLSFSTSDGPIVIGVNVNTTGSPLTKVVVLTFDQNLSTSQDITNFVSTSGIPTLISRQDNKVFISYTNAPLCTNLNVSIIPGLTSNQGVIQNNFWNFSTRTICHTVSTIGYSVNGRPILAYTFGSGATSILYTGSIHGNELGAKYLMEAWINELELNAQNIPSDRKIIVIPTLNPDGVAANRRNNSHNVDLNRNFPVSDWQTDIYSPANQLIPGGGGATPLSEPESQAIAAFSIALRPRLTMSYHGSAAYAIGNQYGNSSVLAVSYSQLTGYSNMTGVVGAFSYPITGTYDDWLREEEGLTSVLVELSSNSSSEFSRNKDALWAMARS